MKYKIGDKVVLAYTSADNAVSQEGAVKWADYVLEEYKKRFIIKLS